MSTGIIVGIVVAVIVIAAVAAWIVVDGRRRRLRQRFGPEYDQLVRERGNRRAAETELAQRQRHVAELNLRLLSPEERTRYKAQWAAIQEEFVERPQDALAGATGIITSAMRDRGYPTEDYEQILADLSVEHGRTLRQFRKAHDISVRASSGSASTEDLRQAMIDYRDVFHDLAGVGTDGAGDRPRIRPDEGRTDLGQRPDHDAADQCRQTESAPDQDRPDQSAPDQGRQTEGAPHQDRLVAGAKTEPDARDAAVTDAQAQQPGSSQGAPRR